MPRASRKSGVKNTLPQFVNCKLTEEEIVYVQAHLLDNAGVVDFIVKVSESGVKFSVAWDEWNDCVIVTLTAKGEKEGDTAAALSSRGPGVYEAVSVSAFKFHEKLDGNILSAPAQNSKQSWG